MAGFTWVVIRAVLSSISIAAMSNVAKAQTASNCVSIEDPTGRLACYDRAFPPKQVKKPQAKPSAGTPATIDANALCKPKELVEAILALVPKKSDFETADEHSRKAKLVVDSSPVFSQNITCEIARPHLIRYKAEQKAYDVFSLGAWDSQEDVTGSYESSNAYGARVTVEKKNSYRWQVEGADLGSFLIPMTPSEAERRSGKIRVAVIGSVRAPYSSEEAYTSTPTFRQPEEVRSVTKRIFFAPRQVVAFDKDTSEVFWSANIIRCKKYEFSEDTELRVGSCDKRY